MFSIIIVIRSIIVLNVKYEGNCKIPVFYVYNFLAYYIKLDGATLSFQLNNHIIITENDVKRNYKRIIINIDIKYYQAKDFIIYRLI